MKTEERTPVLVGSGQVTQRICNRTFRPDLKTALGPIDMMAEAAKLAVADAGLGPDAIREIDSVRMVEVLSGIYEDHVEVLTRRLGIEVRDRIYTETGGNSPQMLVNATAEALAEGRVDFALLCGVEVLASLPAALTGGVVPDWCERDGAELGVVRPPSVATSDVEAAHGLQPPINVYPLFENALRAHYGWSIEEHLDRLGRLFSGFSKVASENPNAWFRKAYTPEEIATVSQNNRMVGFPYTKLMNAFMRVDQSAAVLMTTFGKARELGIDSSQLVYLHGCADAKDHWYVTERANFYSSPAIRLAGAKALEMAGCSIGDIEYLDLYSCFPSPVELTRDALGIALEDPRPLTVTGGHPYHGGPGSNYVMHAIATMMGRLRADPASKGLCSAVGWYNTKHAIGVYSTQPVEGPWAREDPARYQAEIDAGPKVELAAEPEGPGTVETYTVICGRSGPERGLIVGRLKDGRRFLAVTPDDPALYQRMMSEEAIGQSGHVESGTPVNTFRFANP
ncbi:MAG: acetyl-CoA acetyltransferase [Candidatus Hydrogenedentes bacterium]|nr:acetyl-CoA acetyltransferase [Candidatus Hydrogenedentota bacterium]